MSPLLLPLEVVLIFSLGVLGNKIADVLKIEPVVLVVLTVVFILAATAVSVARSSQNAIPIDDGSNFFRGSLVFPSTIAGMIPVGLVVGLSCGLIIGLSIGQTPQFAGALMPLKVQEYLLGIVIYSDDLTASLVGIVGACVLAVVLRPILASGIALGYGLGVAPALLLVAHAKHLASFTIIGSFVEFLIVAVLIAHFRGSFEKARRVLTKYRT